MCRRCGLPSQNTLLLALYNQRHCPRACACAKRPSIELNTNGCQQGGTLRNYWTCLPRWSAHSLHVKTIVNTEHAKAAKG